VSESTFRFWRLPHRDAESTRRLVRLVAKLYGSNPRMRQFVVERVLRPAGVTARDELAAVRAIWRWVRDHVDFWNEAGESVLTPGRVLLVRYGDCDDRSGLVAAMLEAIRIPWDLVLLARRMPGRGLVPFHIWPRARLAGQSFHLETCHPDARFDEHPAALMARLRGLSL
jgi:transglutaminase-like putative cysteine protease